MNHRQVEGQVEGHHGSSLLFPECALSDWIPTLWASYLPIGTESKKTAIAKEVAVQTVNRWAVVKRMTFSGFPSSLLLFSSHLLNHFFLFTNNTFLFTKIKIMDVSTPSSVLPKSASVLATTSNSCFTT